MTKSNFSTLLIATIFLFGDLAPAADIGSGKQLARLCADCHGQDGNSTNPIFPRLAGQQPSYLVIQIKAFRDGQRKHQIMEGMVKNISDTDAEHIAAYFASLEPKSVGSNRELAGAGKKVFASNCASCHRPNAEGSGPQPRLAGQHPAYLFQQLKNFKSGQRNNFIMKSMTSSLTEEKMRAVAEYLGSIEM